MPTEMLIAAAILLTILGAALSVVSPAQGALTVQPQIIEMHQRLRGTSARLQSDLVMAGSGPHTVETPSLSSLRAPVIPAILGRNYPRTNGATFSPHVLSLLYVPPGRSGARLGSALAGASPVVRLVPDTGVVRGAEWCVQRAASSAMASRSRTTQPAGRTSSG